MKQTGAIYLAILEQQSFGNSKNVANFLQIKNNIAAIGGKIWTCD